MNMVCCCQVCDEPHPLLIKDMLQHCVNGNVDEAYKIMAHLWRLGYSAEDIIGIIFRVCKTHDMPEYLKLEFIKVRRASYVCQFAFEAPEQQCWCFEFDTHVMFFVPIYFF